MVISEPCRVREGLGAESTNLGQQNLWELSELGKHIKALKVTSRITGVFYGSYNSSSTWEKHYIQSSELKIKGDFINVLYILGP